MGGALDTLKAKTKTELKRKVQNWIKEAREKGLEDIRQGWDPERIVKTKDGYEITVWAHS